LGHSPIGNDRDHRGAVASLDDEAELSGFQWSVGSSEEDPPLFETQEA